MARFYARSRLSERKLLTPEGYLLCLDVPLARTGALDYTEDEVPEGLTCDKDGLVTVHREAADLFDPAAMASFEGKPLTVGHPDDDVSPQTWRDLAAGHAQNVRRGSGTDADLLLADILVTDAGAIEAIDDGLVEISLGYDTEYTKISPGVGKQTRLRGNHIALVEAGRCGPRCAVRDAIKDEGPKPMKNPLKGLVAAIRGNPALRKAMDAHPKAKKALDEAIAEEVKDQDPAADETVDVTTDSDETSEMLILLRSINEKLDKMSGNGATDEESCTDEGEEKAADEDPVATDDEDDPVITEEDEDTADASGQKDSRTARRTADAATVASARRLAPGLSVRVGDSAIAVKRAALAHACRDQRIRAVVDSITGRRGIKGADATTLHAAFTAAAAVARDQASRRTSDTLTTAGRGSVRDNAPVTPADLNALFTAHRKGEA